MNTRCIILEHAVCVTGLSNVEYERKSRGQNRGKKVSFREKFDVAVARAVAEMRILGGSKKCREVTPIDGRISLATGPRVAVRIIPNSNSIMDSCGSSSLICIMVEGPHVSLWHRPCQLSGHHC
ncbi:PREDICTED: uncharacterized protein LOC105128598 isoform X2 [Populus euphratica]|uniref:Uncharacterized protein LOC105128598 isoform X2 n=1 Tax=Populus euphratica TaxID=75702 RepID=A0AAJ6XRX5_POPEU|nr:PREDICTED: uncharacterized protein LOC105128598 isoform X2 [Populus euphratica]